MSNVFKPKNQCSFSRRLFSLTHFLTELHVTDIALVHLALMPFVSLLKIWTISVSEHVGCWTSPHVILKTRESDNPQELIRFRLGLKIRSGSSFDPDKTSLSPNTVSPSSTLRVRFLAGDITFQILDGVNLLQETRQRSYASETFEFRSTRSFRLSGWLANV